MADNPTILIIDCDDSTSRNVLATKASTTGPLSPCNKCTSSIISNFTNVASDTSPVIHDK